MDIASTPAVALPKGKYPPAGATFYRSLRLNRPLPPPPQHMRRPQSLEASRDEKHEMHCLVHEARRWDQEQAYRSGRTRHPTPAAARPGRPSCYTKRLLPQNGQIFRLTFSG